MSIWLKKIFPNYISFFQIIWETSENQICVEIIGPTQTKICKKTGEIKLTSTNEQYLFMLH